MSLLGSSVLSRFSGVVDCRLVFLCFMLGLLKPKKEWEASLETKVTEMNLV